MGMKIDEAWSHHQAGSVDHATRGGMDETADRRDFAAFDCDRSFIPWTPGSINDVSIDDQEIVLRLSGSASGTLGAENDSHQAKSHAAKHPKAKMQPKIISETSQFENLFNIKKSFPQKQESAWV